MHLGLDLDNTIVLYDRLFHDLARERGLIDDTVAATKAAVRDAVREVEGGLPRWIALQGLAYGAEIARAGLAPGVTDLLRACRERRVEVSIVSHKTRFPNLPEDAPERSDLHAAALGFLTRAGLLDGSLGLTPARVHFRPTRVDKLAQVAALGCTHFVDDLLEVVTDPTFPAGVEPILIGVALDAAPPGVVGCPGWPEVQAHLFS